MREKELFRENLALIQERFGDRQLIPVVEVAKYLGLNAQTVREHYPIKKVGRMYYVTAVTLARELS